MSSRPTKCKLVASKRTAAVNTGIARLEKYSSTNALAQSLMNTIKQQYESREIQNVTTAIPAMDSLKANAFNEFSKTFANIAKAILVKQAKLKTAREA